MPDQPTAPAEQASPPPESGRRRVDPGKVIAKLTETIGEQAQQLAAHAVLVDDLTEENAGLRAELVAATSGTVPSGQSQ